MDEIKRESGGVVPTVISKAAWDAAMLLSQEVAQLLAEAGMFHRAGQSKSTETMARLIQHAINRELDAIAPSENYDPSFDMSRLKPPSANQTHIGGPYSSLKQPQTTPEVSVAPSEGIAMKLFLALEELVAQVRGECPSLLNEDSGGDGDLSIEIDEALDAYKKAEAAHAK